MHAPASTLDIHRARIEAALERLLPPPDPALPERRVVEAMRYSLLAGGKRLRPVLCLAAAEAVGGPNATAADVDRACAAIECVHTYSLIHDDLPAMDDDDLRRGKPTVHRAFDEATAILAGDGLLTYSFDVMADPATHPDPAVRCELALGLARASGLGGMAGGQMLDLAAEASGLALSRSEIERLQAMKTGALLRFGAEAGAIFAKAPADERMALVAYGQALGAAFQIADDILDAEGDEAAMGKRVAKDAGRNKGTLVGALGIEAARTLRDALARQAVNALAPFGARADVLAEAARFTARRAH